MLLKVKSLMQLLLASDKSRNDVIAANPLHERDPEWGNGFLKTDVFTGIFFDIARDG